LIEQSLHLLRGSRVVGVDDEFCRARLRKIDSELGRSNEIHSVRKWPDIRWKRRCCQAHLHERSQRSDVDNHIQIAPTCYLFSAINEQARLAVRRIDKLPQGLIWGDDERAFIR
jgi:hypothetical protein